MAVSGVVRPRKPTLTPPAVVTVVVPSKAVVIEKGGAYIFVVRPDSIVEKRFIETGPEIGQNIVVERGLVSGEDIVVEGYHKLQHGMKVEPVVTRREEETENQQ